MGLVEDLEAAKRRIMSDTGMRPPAPFVIGHRDFEALYQAARRVEGERDRLQLKLDVLIDGVREALTLLKEVPSTPELCNVARAIQVGVNRMDAVV